jgi:hypothetical protein
MLKSTSGPTRFPTKTWYAFPVSHTHYSNQNARCMLINLVNVCINGSVDKHVKLHTVSYIWNRSIHSCQSLRRYSSAASFVLWNSCRLRLLLKSSWNVMAHGDAREGKWRGNWRMKWVASTLHTTSEHGVSSITTADAHTSAASSPLNWCPRRFKWTRPFRRKTKSGFCTCAITFQTQSISQIFDRLRDHEWNLCCEILKNKWLIRMRNFISDQNK